MKIRYIDRDLELTLPDKNILFDIVPRDIAPVTDWQSMLYDALTNPIGTPKIAHLLRPGQHVTLIVDDNTRPTPLDRILPLLLNELNRLGVPDSHIQAVIASGTHRAMTDREKLEKYGQPLFGRIPFLDHHYKDPHSLVDYGTTKRGTRILVNKDVIQADFRIAIGNIIPHHPSGWSAGAKAVLPGVGGEETVAQMHFLGSRYPALGKVDTPMRQEMEDFAEKINLNFIFNVILNRNSELVAAVSGHFIQAHRRGVELSRTIYGLPIPELADLVISSTAPVDFDLFQGDKGITSAEPATRSGGEIILVSGCVEGISPAHPELADYLGNKTTTQLWEMLGNKDIPDPLTGAEAVVLNDIKAKMKITLVTEGISRVVCQSMGFHHVSPEELNDYITLLLQDNPSLKIGIMRHSAELAPFVSVES